VLLLHGGRRDIAEVANRIWYPIWDTGIGLDHSVRAADEALSVASTDLRTMLGLLDGRFIAGSHELADRVLTRVRHQSQKHARRWAPILAGSIVERHEKFGHVAFLLEPDLKEGKGGLRDVALLRAIAHAVPVALTDDVDVARQHDLLLSARVELHRASGRPSNVLLLERQDDVAERLGMADADVLMADIAEAARSIAWALDEVWRRLETWVAGPPKRNVNGRQQPIGRGIVLRGGEVGLGAEASPAEDSSLALRVGAVSAYVGAPIERASLVRLQDLAPAPDAPWSDDTRNALVSLLGGGEAMVPVFETLDHFGLITRVFPEWEAVRSKPQRNAFHRYTVDRHLLEAVAQAALLTRSVTRPDLLLVGAFLHDIGKGFPGDHTDAGVIIVGELAGRMGFPPEDVDVLVTLVREHLLLAKVATGRDLDDPATIRLVEQSVGNRDVLELLAALTEADSIATGETAWSPWKKQLMGDLVARVGAALAGVEPTMGEPARRDEHARLAARAAGDVLVEEQDDGRLLVVAPDRPGFLASVVGLLALHGQSVRSAQAWSSDTGAAVDEFELEAVFDRTPDWPRFAGELREVLAGGRSLDAPIEQRARTYERRPAAARPAEPLVLVHDDASEHATVVEVRAADAVGLLYRVTRVISGLGLDIRHARVATLGHEAVDTFYLRDAAGGQLSDEQAGQLRETVLAELNAPSRPAA